MRVVIAGRVASASPDGVPDGAPRRISIRTRLPGRPPALGDATAMLMVRVPMDDGFLGQRPERRFRVIRVRSLCEWLVAGGDLELLARGHHEPSVVRRSVCRSRGFDALHAKGCEPLFGEYPRYVAAVRA